MGPAHGDNGDDNLPEEKVFVSDDTTVEAPEGNGNGPMAREGPRAAVDSLHR